MVSVIAPLLLNPFFEYGGSHRELDIRSSEIKDSKAASTPIPHIKDIIITITYIRHNNVHIHHSAHDSFSEQPGSESQQIGKEIFRSNKTKGLNRDNAIGQGHLYPTKENPSFKL